MSFGRRSPFEPTSNPAHPAYWKLWTAEWRIEQLRKEITETKLLMGFGLGFEPNFETGDYVVKLLEAHPRTGWGINASRGSPRPERWPVIVGEIIHDLRSALDHLAFQLTATIRQIAYQALDLSHGLPPEWRNISFPIQKSRSKFRTDAERKLWGLENAPRFLEFIEAQQPFARNPTNPEAETLWILNDLWNIDKHRSLHLLGVVLRLSRIDFIPEVEVLDSDHGDWFAADERAVLGRFKLATPLPRKDLVSDYRTEQDVALRQVETGEPRALSGTLRDLAREVKRVLDEFQDLYYGPLQSSKPPHKKPTSEPKTTIKNQEGPATK